MKTQISSSQGLLIALVTCALVSSVGCGAREWNPSKMFSLDSTWPFDDDEDEPEEGVPVRLVGAWTDTVMTKPGEKPQRGFGGRLMFYGAKEEKPILVDGQLVVYAFNEAGREPTDNKPTRRYVFPPEQLPLHMSKSDIGASYSFWLPWDEAGGPKTEVSLICRFQPKGGPAIAGEQTRHLLPGPEVSESVAAEIPKVPEGEPFRAARATLESLQSQKNKEAEARLVSYEGAASAQAMAATANGAALPTGAYVPGAANVGAVSNAAGVPNVAGATGIAGAADAAGVSGRQMTVTSIALPNHFQLPEPMASQRTTVGMPVTTQGVQPRPLQPALYQQPAGGIQPIQRPVPPTLMNGGAVQQFQGTQMQPVSMPVAAARPTLPTIASPVVYSPSYPGGTMPRVGTPYSLSGAAPVQAAQPMMSAGLSTQLGPPQVGGVQAAPPMAATQQAANATSQPLLPQQSWQQYPATNSMQSASTSPTTATIPWR